MTDKNKTTKPRAGIRFTAEGNEFGYICYNLDEYKPDVAVFVINESIHGSCLIVNRKLIPPHITFKPGMNIIVKVGNLDPVTTIVRWVKNLDEDVVKLGVENTEKRHVIKFK